MKQFIETYFANNERLERDLTILRSFFDQPAVFGALRLVLAGLMPTTKVGLSYSGFQNDFCAFMAQTGQNTDLGEHELKRQILQLVNQPKDRDLKVMLGLYCAHVLTLNPLRVEDPRVRPGLECVDFVSRLRNFIEKGDVRALQVSKDEFHQQKPHRGTAERLENGSAYLRHWGQQGTKKLEILNRAFFHLPENFAPTARDSSYYIAYRFSTEKGRIVKTLLTIDAAAADGVHDYAFSHIYSARNGIERITSGDLLLYRRNIYLVGQSARRLQNGTENPSALKAIALNVLDLEIDYKKATGVFLSTALNWQPIVGRFALLHLGFGSKIAAPKKEELGLRANLEKHELKNDIETHLQRDGATHADSDSKDLTEFVLNHANNQPYFDRQRAELAEGLERSIAIEDMSQPKP